MEIYSLTVVEGSGLRVKGKGLRRGFLEGVLLLTLHPLLFSAVQDGYVVRVDSPAIYLDWGKAADIHVGDSFDVYRAGSPLKHPVTGEILGQTEEAEGSGVIQTVEEKFSVGHIVDQRGEWKAGDRTRLKTSAPVIPVSPAAAAVVPSNTPKEIWQSTPIAGEPRGLVIGDLNGDGSNEMVVAFKDRLEVYSWQRDHLEKIATYADRHTINWFSVDVADLDHSGHPHIFATWYLDGVYRARVVVLELSSGTLKEVSHFDGFARVFPREDGSRPLLVQDIALSHELRLTAPRQVVHIKDKYKAGDLIKFPKPLSDNQLFGFAWGDWDNDKSEDWAYLQNGERLTLVFKDKKWSSDASFGGTNLSFSYTNGVDNVATFYPRLMTWKNSAGQSLMLVPHNISTLGIHFARLKLFHGSELVALSWNNLEMATAWRVSSAAYLADFGVAAMTGKEPELWIFTDAPGNKAVITGYRLP